MSDPAAEPKCETEPAEPACAAHWPPAEPARYFAGGTVRAGADGLSRWEVNDTKRPPAWDLLDAPAHKKPRTAEGKAEVEASARLALLETQRRAGRVEAEMAWLKAAGSNLLDFTGRRPGRARPTVGERIEVMWNLSDGSKQWYAGTVCGAGGGVLTILYDDGERGALAKDASWRRVGDASTEPPTPVAAAAAGSAASAATPTVVRRAARPAAQRTPQHWTRLRALCRRSGRGACHARPPTTASL